VKKGEHQERNKSDSSEKNNDQGREEDREVERKKSLNSRSGLSQHSKGKKENARIKGYGSPGNLHQGAPVMLTQKRKGVKKKRFMGPGFKKGGSGELKGGLILTFFPLLAKKEISPGRSSNLKNGGKGSSSRKCLKEVLRFTVWST